MLLAEYTLLKKPAKKEYTVKCYTFSYLDHLYTTWYIEIAEAVSSRPGHHMGSFSRTLYIPDSAPCTCGSSGKWGHTFKYILGFF